MIPIAILNPPPGRRRRKNFWPDNHPGHVRAAKKGWRRKHKRNYGGSMSRRRRFNIGKLLGSSGPASSIASGFKPKNMVAVAPIVAGVIGNNLATSAVATSILKFPIFQSGLGNYALGLGMAGGLGWLGTFIPGVGREFGRGVRIGGMVEVLGRALHDIWSKGVSAALKPNLSGIDDMGIPGVWDQPRWTGFPYGGWARDPFATSGFQGMNDFTTPMKIQNAFPAQSQMLQYAMPAANAVPAQAYHPGMPAPAGSPASMHGMEDPGQAAAISDEIGRSGMGGLL